MKMKNDKAQQIIVAAAGVFAREGFHKATVEEIARKAGVGKGTVYEYFESKDDLFRAMIREGVQLFLKVLAAELACEDGVRAKLIRFVEVSACFLKEHESQARFIMEDAWGLGKSFCQWMAETRQELSGLVREIIEEGVKKGELRPVDPDLVTKVFTGANHALIVSAFSTGEYPDREMATSLVDLLFQGLQP